MTQSATVNTKVTLEDGWVKVATNPLACTIHSNGELGSQIAITIADTAPTVDGERHHGRVDWQSGEVGGYIWVKATDVPVDFAVTVLT